MIPFAEENSMACGESAECIYDLIDHLGGASYDVLGELIKFLPGDVLKAFVDDYTRHRSIMGYEEHELCMECQESYDVNDDHVCAEDDTDSIDKQETLFFSSRIPEC
jgi:hypothetical protein